MEFDRVIKERFAARGFKSDSIGDDLILKILEAGRIAPTAKNQQPQKIYVVRSSEGIKKIDEVSPCRYNAPVVLLICSDKNIAWRKEDYSTFEMDATIVATHMILEATNVGLNSVWVEMFDKEKTKEIFNLDENIEPVCLIPIGYKEDNVVPSPMHTTKKSLEEMVEYI